MRKGDCVVDQHCGESLSTCPSPLLYASRGHYRNAYRGAAGALRVSAAPTGACRMPPFRSHIRPTCRRPVDAHVTAAVATAWRFGNTLQLPWPMLLERRGHTHHCFVHSDTPLAPFSIRSKTIARASQRALIVSVPSALTSTCASGKHQHSHLHSPPRIDSKR